MLVLGNVMKFLDSKQDKALRVISFKDRNTAAAVHLYAEKKLLGFLTSNVLQLSI